jgi:hypothetical protein
VLKWCIAVFEQLYCNCEQMTWHCRVISGHNCVAHNKSCVTKVCIRFWSMLWLLWQNFF